MRGRRVVGMGALGATRADWERLCARSRLPASDPNYRNAPGACAEAARLANPNPTAPPPTNTAEQRAIQEARDRLAAQQAAEARAAQERAARLAAEQQAATARAAATAAQQAATAAAAERDAANRRREGVVTQTVLNKSRYVDTLAQFNELRRQAGLPAVSQAAEHQGAVVPALNTLRPTSPVYLPTGPSTDALAEPDSFPISQYSNGSTPQINRAALAAVGSGGSGTSPVIFYVAAAAIGAMLLFRSKRKGGK